MCPIVDARNPLNLELQASYKESLYRAKSPRDWQPARCGIFEAVVVAGSDAFDLKKRS